MTPEEAATIRDNCCTTKKSYGRDTARNVAAAHSTDPEHPIRAYRCPFCTEWHIGHVPSHEATQRLAAAIRFFATGYEGS